MAHLHVPKPLHGWREFVGEVGIIVLGVLIALGAEQMVEHFRAEAQKSDIEHAMRSEIRDDDLPEAYARASVHDCFAAQLNSIETAVASGADRTQVLAAARAYGPVFRSWDDEAWKAALASPAFIQSGPEKIIGWAGAYGPTSVLMQQATDEQGELPELRTNFSGTGPLSPVQQDRLFHAIAVLRAANERMTGGSTVFMKGAADIGLKLTAAKESQIVGEARQKYGSCAKPPSLPQINYSGQFSSARPRD